MLVVSFSFFDGVSWVFWVDVEAWKSHSRDLPSEFVHDDVLVTCADGSQSHADVELLFPQVFGCVVPDLGFLHGLSGLACYIWLLLVLIFGGCWVTSVFGLITH